MGKERLGILKERLRLYYDAEKKILKGQSYSIGSQQLTRANLSQVQQKIADLEQEIRAIEENGTTRRRMRRVIPLE